MADHDQLKKKFMELYSGGSGEIRIFYAPGRVNLIGEHTDYNGGAVFPAALSVGTTVLLRKREDKTLNLASENFTLQVSRTIDDLAFRKEDEWANYPKGILYHLQQKGHSFSGYDMLISGEIPNGAGLSSSASILVACGFAFLSMENIKPDNIQLALIAQEAENQYMGVNCGIMDQFAVAMGEKNHVILLKCNTLEYELVPFQSDEYKLVIGNTNKRRGLVDSEYNLRRTQCEQAVEDLQQAFPDIRFLAELNLKQFEEHAELFRNEEVKKRAAHVIAENDRVYHSVQALKQNDFRQFGDFMNASHKSLRDQYEVSCKELDTMVEAAWNTEGVLGSRMTGAGFGGCTVSLVENGAVEQFIRKVGEEYAQKTSFEATFYVASIGQGVGEITS